MQAQRMPIFKQVRRFFLLHRALTTIAVLCAMAMSFVSLKYYILDSEFWSMTLAKELFNTKTEQISLYYKIPFYFFLNIAHWLSHDNVTVVLFSRALFALVSCAVLYLTYKIARELFKSRLLAIVPVYILFSVSFYFVHSTQVRSDILACLFLLLTWLQILKIKKQDWRSLPRQNIFLFFSSLTMFMSTPKAIILFGLLVVILASEFATSQGQSKMRVKKICVLVSSPLLLMLIAYLISHFAFAQKFSQAYKSAYSYFQSNILYGLTDTYTLSTFFYDNTLFVIGAILALIYGAAHIILLRRSATQNGQLARAKTMKYQFSILTYANAFSVLAIALHSQRTQYYIAIFLPFFALLITAVLSHFSRNFKHKYISALLFASICVFKMAFVIDYSVRHFSNTEQMQFIRYLEDYLSEYPQADYYDSIGVLPKKSQIYGYITPNDQMYQFHAEKIIHNEPDLILYTTRVSLIGEYIDQFLKEKYIEISKDFWVKKIILNRSVRIYNNQTYSAVNLFDLSRNYSTSQDEKLNIFVYDSSDGGLAKPTNFRVHDKITGNVIEFYITFEANYFLFEQYESSQRYFGDFELLLYSHQQISLYKPFEQPQITQSPKYLFSYRSFF